MTLVFTHAKTRAIGGPYWAPTAGAKQIAVVLPKADTEKLLALGQRRQIEPKSVSIACVPNYNTGHFRHIFDRKRDHITHVRAVRCFKQGTAC